MLCERVRLGMFEARFDLLFISAVQYKLAAFPGPKSHG